MDYPCAKFGDFSFSRFGYIVWTDRQTDRQTGIVEDDTGSCDVTTQRVHATEAVGLEAKSTEIRSTLFVHVRAYKQPTNCCNYIID